MSVRIQGNQVEGLIRQTGDSLSQREDGTFDATVRFVCRWADIMVYAPRRNSARHPDFPTLICNGIQGTRLKPGIMVELTATYRGVVGSTPDPGNELGNSTEEVITSMSEAPIETNPKFVTDIGGTQANPLNDAVFNDDGTFKGWKVTSRFAGKESYLIPSTIYRRSTPSRTRPSSVGPVGTISSPGIGSPATTNWLYTARTWRRDGGVYEVSDEYMLSGPGGWDPVIYG